MLGRSTFDLGELDKFQYFLWIMGTGNTGKSTILKFVKAFYDVSDIGFISNSIESTFGWSPHANKFLCIADDIKNDAKYNDGDLQTMTSGGTLDASWIIRTHGTVARIASACESERRGRAGPCNTNRIS